jgi:hypothetical protein
MCCFCGEYAEMDIPDFFMLIVCLNEEASQNLWAHGKCLRDAVHPTIPMVPPEDE